MIQAYVVQSIIPRCNDSQSSIGKNAVEFQNLDKELRGHLQAHQLKLVGS